MCSLHSIIITMHDGFQYSSEIWNDYQNQSRRDFKWDGFFLLLEVIIGVGGAIGLMENPEMLKSLREFSMISKNYHIMKKVADPSKDLLAL